MRTTGAASTGLVSVSSLSTFYTPTQADQWPEAVGIVEQVGLDGQLPIRRWEYSVALEAIRRWKAEQTCGCQSFTLVDVGGAGSKFVRMAEALGVAGTVVDPNAVGPNAEALSLSDYVHKKPKLADIVTCLSVLEHVDDLDQTLYHLGCLVRPGGLLVLTVDACDSEVLGSWPEDKYHFHWMRKRIFNHHQLRDQTYIPLVRYGFDPVVPRDYVWPGTFVECYDYGVASLVLTKRI